ncbi:MAG: bifunctional phosphoribosylaminoimidazolecarboxamide formyltransferase/IMP cyclohydrolase, partial [Pseudomonadota bacterium]
RALISVSDKRGVLAFAQTLATAGVELLSTGGTARALREGGLDVIDVADITGFPEMMDGRVKTLHPAIHGALLRRPGTDDVALETHNITPVDLLVVNLYPFADTINQADVSIEAAIEQIDIGGPAMLRAAAKNHAAVTVVVSPDDYESIADLVNQQQAPDAALRRRLAALAFAHTAAYDSAIADYLKSSIELAPQTDDFSIGGHRVDTLRYGENPHQAASFYRTAKQVPGSIAAARMLQGKALSYNNIADGDAALECVRAFAQPACVIVKHANPCGVAVSATLDDAYDAAFATDPTSAFGGIIAFNRRVPGALARRIVERQFVEVVIAPEFDDEAMAAFGQKKNVRLLKTGPLRSIPAAQEIKAVSGGFLIQDRDDGRISEDELKVVTERQPTASEIRDLLFAWQVVKFVKSNAIVFCRDERTIGIGAGQMSRVYSTRIAAIKAADEDLVVKGSVMASDAFFPFRDGLDSAAEHGITAVIQPGGSMRDDEVIAAANEHGLAMVFTGMRHFRH